MDRAQEYCSEPIPTPRCEVEQRWRRDTDLMVETFYQKR
jgi:hypothetical protein